ncbi:MAG: ketoacyl-ACP synthase III [Phycisphaerae bacterium]|nr:ketoacyl-ACP synthase III [Phycisphaerae bacterium]
MSGPQQPGGLPRVGVRIAGTGSCLPERKLTNADLVAMMETSDEWIVQRTGIRERRISDHEGRESTGKLAAESLRRALAAAHMSAKDLDLIIVSTMTPEMSCPPTACLVAAQVGAGNCGAFDINGACCGFVFGLNTAHALVASGAYRNVALIGADTLTHLMDYSDAGRSTAIIFGDAAGCALLRATDDTSKGIIAQSMHSDGQGWKEIYVPCKPYHFPEGTPVDERKYGRVQMNGSAVFKFAVHTFSNLIDETLQKARLKPSDIDLYICHQSNQRILHAARDRFGLPEDKLYINIDRVGNTVAASVPLCLDEVVRARGLPEGAKVLFVAFGGGLTWGSSLWQL